MRLIAITTPPASEPITLAEAKNYLRIDSSDDDSLISTLITAVRMNAEQYIRRALITQSVTLAYDDYAPSIIPLAMPPAQSITSITVYDADDNATIIANSEYRLSANKEQIFIDNAIFAERVEIIYITGYGDNATDVPAAIRQGMLIHLAELYDQRASDSQIPASVKTLYNPFRRIGI